MTCVATTANLGNPNIGNAEFYMRFQNEGTCQEGEGMTNPVMTGYQVSTRSLRVIWKVKLIIKYKTYDSR